MSWLKKAWEWVKEHTMIVVIVVAAAFASVLTWLLGRPDSLKKIREKRAEKINDRLDRLAERDDERDKEVDDLVESTRESTSEMFNEANARLEAEKAMLEEERRLAEKNEKDVNDEIDKLEGFDDVRFRR